MENTKIKRLHTYPPLLSPIIMEEEMEKILFYLRDDKSPGPNRIENELFTRISKRITRPLTQTFNKIIESETIPHQRETSDIILLYKIEKGFSNPFRNFLRVKNKDHVSRPSRSCFKSFESCPPASIRISPSPRAYTEETVRRV